MLEEPFTYASSPSSRNLATILKIVGPLTLNNIFALQADFREMRPPALIVDLTECPYMDSAGLGIIMNQFVSAETGKRRFLLAGVSGRIESLLDLTKVSTVLKTYRTVVEAEDALSL